MKYLEKILTDLSGTPYLGLSREAWALEFISSLGWCDGYHHKQWVLDQVARILCDTPVIVKQATWSENDKIIHTKYKFDVADEPTKAYRIWASTAGGIFTRFYPTLPQKHEVALMFIAENTQPVMKIELDERKAMTADAQIDFNTRLHNLDLHCAWMLDQVAAILHGSEVKSLVPVVLGDLSANYHGWVNEINDRDDGDEEADGNDGNEDLDDEDDCDRYEHGEALPASERRIGPYYEGIAP